jgi:hypothetical protein
MRILAPLLLFLSIAADATAQCAMCKSALTGSTEGARIALGMNSAILFLLAAPFLLVAAFGGVLLRRRRRLTEV